MNCLFCSAEISATSKNCHECGTKLADFEAHADSDENKALFRDELRDLLAYDETLQFGGETISGIEPGSEGLRRKLFISYEAGQAIFNAVQAEFKKWSKFLACTLEFDENLTDAYAGGDTLLRFRFKNNSKETIKSLQIFWDDKETPNDEDYQVQSPGLILKDADIIVEGTHVFTRPGPKTIGGTKNDLIVTIEVMRSNQLTFRTSPFSFTVANPNQNVFNSISNTTSINVDAERVVGTFDASHAGAKQTSEKPTGAKQPRWVSLKLFPVLSPTAQDNAQIERLASTVTPQKAPAPPPEKTAPVPTDVAAADSIAAKSRPTNPAAAGFELFVDPLPPIGDAAIAVSRFINALIALSSVSPAHKTRSVLLPLDISLDLVQTITQAVRGLTIDDIAGILLLDPESAFLDDGGFVTGFDNRAYVITPYGFYETQGGSHSEEFAHASWKSWQSQGLGPLLRRFSDRQFLIFIGDKRGWAVPGFSFDLRRYNGDAPIENAYKALSDAFKFLVHNGPEAPQSDQVESGNAGEELVPEDTEEDSEADADQATIDLRDRSNQYVANDVSVAAADFFQILTLMHAWGNEHGYKVCLTEYLHPELINSVYIYSGFTATEEIKGLVVETPETITLDKNIVTGFEGRAVAVCDWGISVLACSAGVFESIEDITWTDFNRYELHFYRFGDPGKHFYAISKKDTAPATPLMLDFSGVDCDEIQDDGYSINNSWERGWDIISALRDAHPFDPNEAQDNKDADLEDDDLNAESVVEEQDPSIARAESAREDGSTFFAILSLSLQQCSETNPKSVFVGDEITPEHLHALHAAFGEAGVGPYAVAVDPSQVELSYDGKLTGWKGFATALTPEGLFHLARADDGRYKTDGKNSFLAWRKFFNDYGGGLQIREDGPDLWLGTSDKVMVRSTYCDYSSNIAQWDYFEDFVKSDLLKALQTLKAHY